MSGKQPTLGAYTLIQKIGAGGSGEVFHAKQSGLDRDVALKVFHPDLGLKGPAFEAYKTQVMNLLGMSHPNLVRAIDCGVEGGREVLALEVVEGSTLKKIVDQAGPFTPQLVLPILAGIAEGLAALHEGGVVHGALTLHNVVFTKTGGVEIMDYPPGLRTSADVLARLKRAPGNIVALAPEVAAGGDLRPESDVFAFGVLAYQLLTQQQPFRIKSAREWIDKVQKEAPILPEEHGIELPESVVTFVFGCLDRDPANRHGARDLVDVLDYLTVELDLPGEELSLELLKKCSLKNSRRTRVKKPRPLSQRTVTPPPPPQGMDRIKVWHLLAICGGVVALFLGVALLRPEPGEVVDKTDPKLLQVEEVDEAPRGEPLGFPTKRIAVTDSGLFLRLETARPVGLEVEIQEKGETVAGESSPGGTSHRLDLAVEPGKDYRISYEVTGAPAQFFPPYDWIRSPTTEEFDRRAGAAIGPLVKATAEVSRLAAAAKEVGGTAAFDAAIAEHDGALAQLQVFLEISTAWESPAMYSPKVRKYLLDWLTLHDRRWIHRGLFQALGRVGGPEITRALLALPATDDSRGGAVFEDVGALQEALRLVSTPESLAAARKLDALKVPVSRKAEMSRSMRRLQEVFARHHGGPSAESGGTEGSAGVEGSGEIQLLIRALNGKKATEADAALAGGDLYQQFVAALGALLRGSDPETLPSIKGHPADPDGSFLIGPTIWKKIADSIRRKPGSNFGVYLVDPTIGEIDAGWTAAIGDVLVVEMIGIVPHIDLRQEDPEADSGLRHDVHLTMRTGSVEAPVTWPGNRAYDVFKSANVVCQADGPIQVRCRLGSGTPERPVGNPGADGGIWNRGLALVALEFQPRK